MQFYRAACTIFIFINLCAEQEKLIEKVTIKKICEKKEDLNRICCRLLAHTQDDKIVGELIYDETDENSIRICHLLVKKHKRNKGIGKALVTYLLSEIQKKNYSRIEVFSATAATGFYRKFGFICEKEPFDSNFDNVCFCYLGLQEYHDNEKKLPVFN